ncbi:hypothetical protein IMSHALPRED_006421 [Imshaugia aleurites]|uniref:CorA-like transporter domain-containing protein n=1 Tax=Imshaugia aleurites TaxID=172621 RepID=A0A8H3FHE9_9LECA|nr:hypothetical protein IMSHALPRED_006421 [Imshaugia aleurites]
MSHHGHSLIRKADIDTCRSKLDAKRLFTTDETRIEYLSIFTMPDGVGSASRLLTDKKALEACLHMQVKRQPLISFFVFHAFYDLVQGFGLKFEPKDENYTGLRSQLLREAQGSPFISELCYNVRYVAENNRGDPKAPWSERQLAVYHQYSFASNQSVWIIVQPSDTIKRRLTDFGAAASGTTLNFSEHWSLHVLLFTSLVHGWREYINFLESQQVEIDDKALYSKVGSPRKFDFIVTFQDVQDLEIVRRKFIKALLNLRSNAEVGRCWMDRSGNLNGYVDQSDLDENMEVMQEYVLDLERHARVIDSLLSRLDGTRKLLFQILEYRNDELQIQTNKAIQYNGDQLKALTQAASADNGFMTKLTYEIQNDSKFIKILTTIAMFYAPASLIAVGHSYLHDSYDTDSRYTRSGHLQLESGTDSRTSIYQWSHRLRID